MPLLPLSKTLISFEASEISSSPRERQRPSTGSRRWENPEAFDPIRDSFIFKNVAVEPSQERNNNLTGGPGKRQQTRPWTGVLYSSNGRPAAQRASQPAYRDMQPEVKQLFPLEDHPTWASKVSDNKDEPGSGQGLRALLAQSKSREQGVQNSPVGTGKGSRIARAEEDLEKRIQERMARLNAKSVPKHSVLTGWSIQRTKSSENTDIPTPTGNVTSIKTQEPPLNFQLLSIYRKDYINRRNKHLKLGRSAAQCLVGGTVASAAAPKQPNDSKGDWSYHSDEMSAEHK